MPLLDMIKSGATDFDSHDVDTQREIVTATRDALLEQLNDTDWDDAKKNRARAKISADTRSSLRELDFANRAEQELGEGRYAPKPDEEPALPQKLAESVAGTPLRVVGALTSLTGLVTWGIGAVTDAGLDMAGFKSGGAGAQMGKDILAEGGKWFRAGQVFKTEDDDQALGEMIFDSFVLGGTMGYIQGTTALANQGVRLLAPNLARTTAMASAFGNAVGDTMAEGVIRAADPIINADPERPLLSKEAQLAFRAGVGLLVGGVAGATVEGRVQKILGSPRSVELIEEAARTPKGMSDDDWLNSPEFASKLRKAALSADEPHPLEVKFIQTIDDDLPDWLKPGDAASDNLDAPAGPPKIGRLSIEDGESPYGYSEILGVEAKAVEDTRPELAAYLKGLALDDTDVRGGVFSVERIMTGLQNAYRNIGPFAGPVDFERLRGGVLQPLEDLFDSFSPMRPKNEEFLNDFKGLLDQYRMEGALNRSQKYKLLNGVRRLAELPDTYIRGILPGPGQRAQASYNPLANLIEASVKRPELLGHELGHFVFWHQLTGTERINFVEAVSKLSKEEYLRMFPMREDMRARLLSSIDPNLEHTPEFAQEVERTLGWLSRPTEFYAQTFGHYLATNQIPVSGSEGLLGKGLRAARAFFLDQNIKDLPPELQTYFARAFLSPNPSNTARKVSAQAFAKVGLAQSNLHPASMEAAMERVAALESELDGTWQRFEVSGEVKERGQFGPRSDDAAMLAAEDAIAADPNLQRSMVQMVTQQAAEEGWARMLQGVDKDPQLAMKAAKIAATHIYDLPQLLEMWLVKRAHGLETVGDAEIRLAFARLDAAMLPQNYDSTAAKLRQLLKGPSMEEGMPLEQVDAYTGLSYTRADLEQMSEDDLTKAYSRAGEEDRKAIADELQRSRKDARAFRLAQEAHQAQSNRVTALSRLERAYEIGMQLRALPAKNPKRGELLEQFNKLVSEAADMRAGLVQAFPGKTERKWAGQLVTLLNKFSVLEQNSKLWKAARKSIMDHYIKRREDFGEGKLIQNLKDLTPPNQRSFDTRTVAQIAEWELQDMRRALEASRAQVRDYYDLIRMTEQPNNPALRQVLPNYVQHALDGITATPNSTTWKLARNRIAAQLIGFGGGLEFDDEGALTFNPEKWVTSGFILANLGPKNVLRAGKWGAGKLAEKIMANADIIHTWTKLDVERIANYPYRRMFRHFREDRGLAPQHGEVLRALQDFEAGKNSIADTMNRLAKSLADEFTVAERKIISDIIEEEGDWMHYGQVQKFENAVRDIRKHYADIRSMMQEAGTVPDMVDFDSIDERYLNRIYLRPEQDLKSRFKDAALRKLHYNYLRMRGLEKEIKPNSAEARQLISDLGSLDNIYIGDKIKAFNAADANSPMEMRYFHERGGRRPDVALMLSSGPEWTVKRVDADGRITLWRDYSPEERALRNEQRDVVARVMAHGKAVSEDFALAKLFKRISDMPNVVFDLATSNLDEAALTNKLRDLTEYPPSHQRWITVPNTVDKELGIPIYGSLSGKLVHPEVMGILSMATRGRQLDNLPDALRMLHRLAWRPYVGALRLWKIGKTALNPVSHVNNWMGNSLMTYINGYNPVEVMRLGIDSLRKKDAHYMDAEVHMLMDTTMLRADMDTRVFQEIMEDFRSAAMGADSPSAEVIAAPGLMSKAMGAAMKAGRATGRGVMAYADIMQQAYQYGDFIWKLGLYRKLRGQNWTEAKAIDEVNRLFFDYRHVPDGVKFVRDSGIAPFVTYTYKAIPVVAKALLERPERVLGTFLAAEAFTQLMYNWEYGEKGKAMREYHEAVEPAWAKNKTFGMFNFRAPIGFDGQSVTNLDMSRWFPAGDLFEQGGPVASYPFAFNPFIATLFAASTDMDPTYLREFAKSGDLDDPRVDAAKWEAKKKFIMNTWLPNLPIPFTYSYAGEKIGEALTSAGVMPKEISDSMGWTGKDYAGYDMPPGQTIMGALGVKTRTIDPDTNFPAQMRYIRAQIAREKSELAKALRSPRTTEMEQAESFQRFDSARETGINQMQKLQEAKGRAERTPGFAR